MRKVCIVTGTRAEYGLLYWLMKEVEADQDLKLQLIVTGMHLSPEFGLTYQEIEKEFAIDKKIEMLLSSDTPIGISKSMGLAQISFAEAYAELKPDIVVVLGDRYEIFAAAGAAMIARIPIAHIHGGEATEGAFDEAIRHSITKMAHLHFVAADAYRRRVIQLGEHPDRVFNVGGMGIENIKRLKLLNRKEFEEAIGFKPGLQNLLVTFHPVTLENATAQEQFENLLEALNEQPEAHIIFTKANSDTDGRIINRMIDAFVAKNPQRSVAFASLGQLRYLSALQFMDAVVGNSSSGLLEAPSFKIGTINIGDRQKGRLMADSVICCPPKKEEIVRALKTLRAPTFQARLKDVKNPYGEGMPSKAIKEKLKEVAMGAELLKKTFYDLDMCL
ncbi:MAG: UDP-N-acetylglucosamine 2-epimerase [Campylobacterales bacterium]